MDQHREASTAIAWTIFRQSAFPAGEDVPGAFWQDVPGCRERYDKKVYFSTDLRIVPCNAQWLIDDNQYAAALSLLENGRRFITANGSMAGFEPDEKLRSRAAEGILDSYAGIASSCLMAQKFEMADSYLEKADQYALKHAKYIRSDSSYRSVFSKLFFMRNEKCDKLLDQEKYSEALECYRQFESRYSPRELARVREHLNSKKIDCHAWTKQTFGNPFRRCPET